MKRWLRQHQYALAVSLRRLALQPFSSLANLLVIALTLSVPIMAAAILVSAQPVVKTLPVSPEVTLFLKPDAPAKAVAAVAQRLQTDYVGDIQGVRQVSRAQALRQLKSDPTWADALSVLPNNPLPDAVVVTLKDHAELAKHASALAGEWRKIEHVDIVQLDGAWVQRLEAILHFLRIVLGLLAIGVALVVLATVFNTVRMQALTQREEIAVARLVGATEPFVRRPFLYLGALTGALASAMAIGIAAAALVPLNTALARLASSYGSQLSLHMPDAISLALSAVVVAILGALSARWSVTRNTNF